LLFVFSTHAFFLPASPVETRVVFQHPARGFDYAAVAAVLLAKGK